MEGQITSTSDWPTWGEDSIQTFQSYMGNVNDFVSTTTVGCHKSDETTTFGKRSNFKINI